MPMFTYTPKWEAIPAFFDRMKGLLPEGYSGLVGIRLHRTGNPLALEIFGAELPNKPLYPLLTFRVEKGKPTESWERLETDFDVPWVKASDSHLFRLNVMSFYHAEDLLEPRAEAVLAGEADPDAARKCLIDHREAFAGV